MAGRSFFSRIVSLRSGPVFLPGFPGQAPCLRAPDHPDHARKPRTAATLPHSPPLGWTPISYLAGEKSLRKVGRKAKKGGKGGKSREKGTQPTAHGAIKRTGRLKFQLDPTRPNPVHAPYPSPALARPPDRPGRESPSRFRRKKTNGARSIKGYRGVTLGRSWADAYPLPPVVRRRPSGSPPAPAPAPSKSPR